MPGGGTGTGMPPEGGRGTGVTGDAPAGPLAGGTGRPPPNPAPKGFAPASAFLRENSTSRAPAATPRRIDASSPLDQARKPGANHTSTEYEAPGGTFSTV